MRFASALPFRRADPFLSIFSHRLLLNISPLDHPYKGKRDYDKAFPLFMLAGKHGHSDACYRAAQCCEHAWGCKRDQGKAVQLLRYALSLSAPSS